MKIENLTITFEPKGECRTDVNDLQCPNELSFTQWQLSS